MARGCAHWGIASLAVVGLTATRDARACSCIGGVKLDWPSAEAVNLPVDTPLVLGGEVDESMFVARNDDESDDQSTTSDRDAGNAGNAGKLLLVSDNEAIPLTRTRAYPASGCVQQFHFAVPSTTLSANTRYALWHDSTVVSSFTTGESRRNPESERLAAEQLAFEVLGALPDTTRITTAFVTEVQALPLYINFVGSLEESTLSLHARASSVVQLNFGSLECPEVRVLDAVGDALVVKSLCEPARCAHSDGKVVLSSCGGNYALGIDYERFQKLPLGCDDDQTNGTVDEHGGVDNVQPEPQKVGVVQGDRGCALKAPARQSSVGVCALILAAVTLCARTVRSERRKTSA